MNIILQQAEKFSSLVSNEKVNKFVKYVGWSYLTIKSFELLSFFWRIQPFHLRNNLLQKYGRESYALITGCTQGIGYSFAVSLCKQGFNLVLISRSLNKLQEMRDSLHQQYPSSKIVIIDIDFQEANQFSIFKKIQEQTSTLDIAVVVNNVGIDKFEQFSNINYEFIQKMININILTQVSITQLFIDKISSRQSPSNKKGSIIFVGSFAGDTPVKYFQVYGATKAFLKSFARNIHNEYNETIDVLLLSPGEVSTQLIFHKPKGLLVASSDDCADSTLQDVGKYFKTDGATKHKMINSLMRLTSDSIFNFLFTLFKSKKMLSERRKGEIMYHSH